MTDLTRGGYSTTADPGEIDAWLGTFLPDINAPAQVGAPTPAAAEAPANQALDQSWTIFGLAPGAKAAALMSKLGKATRSEVVDDRTIYYFGEEGELGVAMTTATKELAGINMIPSALPFLASKGLVEPLSNAVMGKTAADAKALLGKPDSGEPTMLFYARTRPGWMMTVSLFCDPTCGSVFIDWSRQ